MKFLDEPSPGSPRRLVLLGPAWGAVEAELEILHPVLKGIDFSFHVYLFSLINSSFIRSNLFFRLFRLMLVPNGGWHPSPVRIGAHALCSGPSNTLGIFSIRKHRNVFCTQVAYELPGERCWMRCASVLLYPKYQANVNQCFTPGRGGRDGEQQGAARGCADLGSLCSNV